jgi:hypothetical protein
MNKKVDEYATQPAQERWQRVKELATIIMLNWKRQEGGETND